MIIARTRKGNEFIVKKELEEKGIKCEARPYGYLGVVFVYSDDLETVLKIPEVEYAYKVDIETEAKLEKLEEACKEIAKRINENETFAVRTERRGTHNFTSIDVNVRCGKVIQEISKAKVNLTNPDKLVLIDIYNEKAFISLLPGDYFRKKMKPYKKLALELFKKIVFVQLAYWGPGSYEMGRRIGRAAQAFEIKKLIVGLHDEIKAEDLFNFLRGLFEGLEARKEVQDKTYARKVKRVEITVENIYQLIRKLNPKKQLIIITDPTGEPISKIREKLKKDLEWYEEIYVFAGSREGIPKGLFRFAHYVIDLCPGITFATEHTIPTSLIALYTIYSEEK